MQAWRRVLSVQSHVVRGYCGNKAAVPMLQLRGFDADAVNTVQFSNHTGYPSFTGSVVDGAGLLELVDGLEANGLLRGYSHLLTGYIGSPSLLEAVVEVLRRLRKHNPGLTYVCDPVMGDNGALYVPPDLPAIYRASVVPLATVVCPNQFELEQLTERPAGSITTVDEALAAVDALHALGPETVVVSSLQLGAAGGGEGGGRGSISVLGSTRAPQAAGAPQRFRYELPRRPGYFIGTGDVFAALTLAWVDKMPDNVHGAVGQVLASLQAVLERTAAAEGVAATCDEKTAAAWAARELRLIQSQADILDPPAAFLPSAVDLLG